MLSFFRKYQQFFYVIITVVIVISFSFFGTYNAMPDRVADDPIAFHAVDGGKVKRSDIEALTLFLGTDNEDKLLFGGMWGPNFLNDGVVRKDFLETGLANILISQYANDLRDEWQQRLAKEQKFTLYSHPDAKFISTETAWEYFIPEKKAHYHRLKQAHNALDPQAIQSRISLYIGEKKFPSPSLQKVLKYQEQQYGWVKPDINLDRSDLSLFGYHLLEDWFGPKFLRLISGFIINSARVAEQRGYHVSDAEVMADLMQNAETSFRQNVNNPHLGVPNSGAYLEEQLRRFGMDRRMAIKVWRNVMLFRRMFDDMGNSVLLSPMTFHAFNEHARETATGEAYRLPESLHLGNFRELQQFETYLNAISQGRNNKDLLALPASFLTPKELARKYPELVQKRYRFEIATAEKKVLQNSISIKEMWKWQVQDRGWNKLAKEFADLGLKNAQTSDARFQALEGLDDRTRQKVNAFSRSAMVNEHPEWIARALDKEDPRQISVSVRAKGGSSFIKGLENREELIKLLDQAPLNQSAPHLAQFTGDDKTYYRIVVLERSPEQEILTFAEAQQEGILDKMVSQQLEAYYQRIRSKTPDQFQQQDGSWKALADVREKIAERYFANILKAIRTDYAAKDSQTLTSDQLTNDLTSSLRFYHLLQKAKKTAQDNPELVAIADKEEIQEGSNILSTRETLTDKWKLEKEAFRIERSGKGDTINHEEAFALEKGAWSQVNTLPNGDLYFFILEDKGYDATQPISEQVAEAHRLVADDAQQMLMRKLLQEIKEKNALSLNYMKQRSEYSEDEDS